MSTDDAFFSEYAAFRAWLVDCAYPLWWRDGVDREHGGFHEALALDGMPGQDPRRARLHPRQIYAFAQARALGWPGPAKDAIEHGLRYFVAHYYRADRLIRSLVDVRGAALDESAVLYDQAFALLGYAAAFDSLHDERWLREAQALREEIVGAFGQPIGFAERLDRSPPLLANSHMHLLEACLAWHELDADGWYDIGSHIVELAIDRLLHPHTHVMTEFFDRDWTPLPNEQGHLVEPGHLFEWGWLLLRWAGLSSDPNLERHALRLIEVAEHCVHSQRHVAMNGLALRDDMLIVRDARARLWPQTERIKALLLAARMTGDARCVAGATQALSTLRRYLDVPVLGLWRDTMNVDGTFVDGPAPASSFYHLVAAARECASYVQFRAALTR